MHPRGFPEREPVASHAPRSITGDRRLELEFLPGCRQEAGEVIDEVDGKAVECPFQPSLVGAVPLKNAQNLLLLLLRGW